MSDLSDKIKLGAPVRVRKGAVVRSENPRRREVTVTRPYWVRPTAREKTGAVEEIVWCGSAKYDCRTDIANVDAVEDLS